MGTGSASRIDDPNAAKTYRLEFAYAFVRRESEQNSSLQLNTSASISDVSSYHSPWRHASPRDRFKRLARRTTAISVPLIQLPLLLFPFRVNRVPVILISFRNWFLALARTIT